MRKIPSKTKSLLGKILAIDLCLFITFALMVILSIALSSDLLTFKSNTNITSFDKINIKHSGGMLASNTHISITGDGLVSYNSYSFDLESGRSSEVRRQKTLSSKEISTLISAINKADYFSLARINFAKIPSGCADLFSIQTSITVNSIIYSTSDSGGICENKNKDRKRLRKLERTIMNLAKPR